MEIITQGNLFSDAVNDETQQSSNPVQSDDKAYFPALGASSDHVANAAYSCERKPRVIRLHRCFGCERNFAIQKMSTCLAFCRECLRDIHTGDRKLKAKFIDRTIVRITKYLRRES